MILSDGSALSEMASNQKCQWFVNPYAIISPISNLVSKNVFENLNNSSLEENEIRDNKLGTLNNEKNKSKNNNNIVKSLDKNHVQLNSITRTIIVEFLESNLIGGQIAVYDGIDGKGILLWKCNECTIIPRPIISISSTIFVDFSTDKNSPKGQGFQIIYWQILSSSLTWQDSTGGYILETPLSVNFNTTNNNSFSWYLPASNIQSNLIFQPRYSYTDISSVLTDLVVDGRRAGTDFESYKDTGTWS